LLKFKKYAKKNYEKSSINLNQSEKFLKAHKTLIFSSTHQISYTVAIMLVTCFFTMVVQTKFWQGKLLKIPEKYQKFP
jgi:predicted PurR-regulated permease PerM